MGYSIVFIMILHHIDDINESMRISFMVYSWYDFHFSRSLTFFIFSAYSLLRLSLCWVSFLTNLWNLVLALLHGRAKKTALRVRRRVQRSSMLGCESLDQVNYRHQSTCIANK